MASAAAADVFCVFYIAGDADFDEHHTAKSVQPGGSRKVHKGMLSQWFTSDDPLRDQNFLAKRVACVRIP